MKKRFNERVIHSWRSSVIGLGLVLGAVYVISTQKDQAGVATLLVTAGLGLLGYKEKQP